MKHEAKVGTKNVFLLLYGDLGLCGVGARRGKKRLAPSAKTSLPLSLSLTLFQKSTK